MPNGAWDWKYTKTRQDHPQILSPVELWDEWTRRWRSTHFLFWLTAWWVSKGAFSFFFSSLRKLVRSRNFKNVTSVPRRQKDPGFMSMVKQPGEALPRWRQAGHVVGALRTEGLVGSWPWGRAEPGGQKEGEFGGHLLQEVPKQLPYTKAVSQTGSLCCCGPGRAMSPNRRAVWH